MKSSDNFFQQFKQISKTIAIILSWTIFALLVLIIGFLAYYMISANIYAKKGEKFEPKFSLYTIVSPSMEPNIKVYDVILNTRIDDPADIKVGDVITFISTSTISNGMTVTHRVTRIVNGPEGLEFATKGDNNTIEDTDTAKTKNLLGKVALKIPQLGRLQFFLSTKGGWLLVILFPALLIIVNDIFKIFKLNKAKKTLNEAEKLSEDNEEKIKLETFRKEEIKEKLNKKELKKAKELENKLKSKKENLEEVLNDIPDIKEKKEEIAKGEVKTQEIIEEPEFIPVIDEESVEIKNKNRKIDSEKLKDDKENILESESKEDLEIEDEVKFNLVEGEKENLEEIKFEPVEIKETDENNNGETNQDEYEQIDTEKNKNIFDDEEQHNIFTDDEEKIYIFTQEEPISKTNNIPLEFELPKLKDEK